MAESPTPCHQPRLYIGGYDYQIGRQQGLIRPERSMALRLRSQPHNAGAASCNTGLGTGMKYHAHVRPHLAPDDGPLYQWQHATSKWQPQPLPTPHPPRPEPCQIFSRLVLPQALQRMACSAQMSRSSSIGQLDQLIDRSIAVSSLLTAQRHLMLCSPQQLKYSCHQALWPHSSDLLHQSS